MTKPKSKIGRDRVRGNGKITTLLYPYSTGLTGWTGLEIYFKGQRED
jgi:hypothetical protein